MTVLTFKPRFIAAVQALAKRHTFRVRATYPAPGSALSLRAWSGRPYASPQFPLLPLLPVRKVSPCTISLGQIILDGCSLGSGAAERFAKADGFDRLADLFAFMVAEHQLGTPKTPAIHGAVIYW